MGDTGGNTNRMQMKTTHTIAIHPMSGLHLPRCHGPGSKLLLRRRSSTGVTYAMYRPMTAIDVTARYAVRLNIAGAARTIEQATHNQMEVVGVPVRGLP